MAVPQVLRDAAVQPELLCAVPVRVSELPEVDEPEALCRDALVAQGGRHRARLMAKSVPWDVVAA